MEPLLAVKVGCLVALLFLTLICGMAPAFIRWFLKRRLTGTKHGISFVHLILRTFFSVPNTCLLSFTLVAEISYITQILRCIKDVTCVNNFEDNMRA